MNDKELHIRIQELAEEKGIFYLERYQGVISFPTGRKDILGDNGG